MIVRREENAAWEGTTYVLLVELDWSRHFEGCGRCGKKKRRKGLRGGWEMGEEGRGLG